MLSVKNITKTYGEEIVLQDISFSLSPGERVALVGENGVGKSTLMRIAAKEIEPTEGRVVWGRGERVVYIPQEVKGKQSVRAYLGDAYLAAHPTYIHTLYTLGFTEKDLSRSIDAFSGGERARILFAKIYAGDADVYILDEPTNNLDLPGLVALEKFICKSKKAFIVVSHDREFLDRIATKVFDIDSVSRTLHIHEGGYAAYAQNKKAREAKEWSEYQDATEEQEKLKKSLADIDKDSQATKKKGSRDSDKMVGKWKKDKKVSALHTARKKASRKLLELGGHTTRPKARLPIVFSLDASPSAHQVFRLSRVVKKMGAQALGPIDLTIHYGDRVLIVGENGVGKSTLLSVLIGEQKPDRGTVEVGSRVECAHLPQIAKEQEVHIKDFFKKHLPEKEEGDIRKTLNRFNLTTEDMGKRLGDLSAGLRSRLILALFQLQKPNCLILDEPSNHLDTEVLEKLEEALASFEGTIVCVSHDRRFIKNLKPTKIFVLTKEGVFKTITDIEKNEQEFGHNK